MINRLMKALRTIRDLIWPERTACLVCDELSRGRWLCPDCEHELETLRIDWQEGNVRCAYAYADGARKLIHSLKYNAIRAAAEALADAMAQEAAKLDLPPDVVLTWVTTTRARRWQRGGDHGRMLCTAVAKRLGLPMRQLIVRKKRSRTQRGLTAKKRQHNLDGVFGCAEQLHVPVLIVEDVHTTGATVRACEDALMQGGATAVYAVVATKVFLPQNGRR